LERERPFFRAVILPSEAGWKVKDVLKRHYHFSTSLIRNVKNRGELRINSQTSYFSYEVKAWDVVEVYLAVETKVTPEFSKIEVVYEDSDVLVVNKPAGMVVHPRKRYVSGTLANYIAGHLVQKGERPSSYLVNRLDKETSGLVLAAKNPLAAVILSEEIGEMEKHYLALVHGRVHSEAGVIDLGIVDPKEGVRREVGEDGRKATTKYEVLMRYTDHTLVKAVLLSGRTHQIRVHFSSIGHPLVGDEVYGEGDEGLGRTFLHACHMAFPHPRTGTICQFDAELPVELKEYLNELHR